MDDQMADLALKASLLQNALPFLGQPVLRVLSQQPLASRDPAGVWALTAAPGAEPGLAVPVREL